MSVVIDWASLLGFKSKFVPEGGMFRSHKSQVESISDLRAISTKNKKTRNFDILYEKVSNGSSSVLIFGKGDTFGGYSVQSKLPFDGIVPVPENIDDVQFEVKNEDGQTIQTNYIWCHSFGGQELPEKLGFLVDEFKQEKEWYHGLIYPQKSMRLDTFQELFKRMNWTFVGLETRLTPVGAALKGFPTPFDRDLGDSESLIALEALNDEAIDLSGSDVDRYELLMTTTETLFHCNESFGGFLSQAPLEQLILMEQTLTSYTNVNAMDLSTLDSMLLKVYKKMRELEN